MRVVRAHGPPARSPAASINPWSTLGASRSASFSSLAVYFRSSDSQVADRRLLAKSASPARRASSKRLHALLLRGLSGTE